MKSALLYLDYIESPIDVSAPLFISSLLTDAEIIVARKMFYSITFGGIVHVKFEKLVDSVDVIYNKYSTGKKFAVVRVWMI